MVWSICNENHDVAKSQSQNVKMLATETKMYLKTTFFQYNVAGEWLIFLIIAPTQKDAPLQLKIYTDVLPLHLSRITINSRVIVFA